ncbi:MAG TPA: aromatic ring-hydroxylating dioxygenase subunit alpha [Acidimicrobiia bacterium]|nr:aromatic ring-hydroxylating dioxygenase subunit alpha [Acidimicrobiia bacterium]
MTTLTIPTTADGLVPKERYLSREFLDLEYERLWSRVWQIACREEEIPEVGDYVVYTIGDESVVIVRSGADEISAFPNACLHRGTRLADGSGHVADGSFRCPFHGWRYALDGRVVQVVDVDDFPSIPDDLALPPVRVDRWGGFVFVNLDPEAEPLLDFLDPFPTLLDPYHLEQMKFRGYFTTIIPGNWKAVIDAFNEAYHVQTGHEQVLPWTDDVGIVYEPFDTHAHYGKLAGARRKLMPSPRLGLGEDDYDEGEVLEKWVTNLGGAFLHDERSIVEELRAANLPRGTLLGAYQERRMQLLASRGLDVTGLEPDQMTSADDIYLFPNLVGPVYPGSAILFRVRPDGHDPDRAIMDTWVLVWPNPDREWKMPTRHWYDDWHERDWGPITTQDYENIGRVQLGMKSSGFEGLRLNPRQEANLLHMHRVLDRYLS